MGYKKHIWRYAAIFSFILVIISVCMSLYFNKNKKIIQKEPVSTGVQNRLIEYSEDLDMLFMGTYQNKLVAFQDNGKVWEFDGEGAFSSLKISGTSDILYAANEDNHIYILKAADGSVLRDINVGKRIIAMDISPDESTIAVSSSVKKTKHYLLLLDAEGSELGREKLPSNISEIKFTADGKNLIMGNNRGEIIKTDLEGNELSRYEGNYAVKDLVSTRDGGTLVLLANCKYVLLNADMQFQTAGKPDEKSITPTAVYIDEDEGYVFEGTEERYLFAMKLKDGSTIYRTRLDSAISDIEGIKGRIFVTGYGDWLYSMQIEGLKDAEVSGKILPVLIIVLPALIFIFVFCLLMSFVNTHRFIVKAGKTLWKYKLAYILLLPTFALLIFFNYIPVVMAFTRAFTNWSKDNYAWTQLKFIGLDNFRLMIEEGYFLTGLENLLILMITGIIKVLTVPILVAYLVYNMNSGRQKYTFRFLFVLPMVVPGVVGSLLWKRIYDPTIGLLNQLLGKFGLENLQRVWLGDPKTALWAIIFVGFPFVNALAFLVYYGGFINIQTELIDAARVDGASRWKRFWTIQLPLIRPQISMMLVLTFISTIQDFTNVYLLTGGGPGKSTYVPGLELYYNATQFGRYGYACALGLIMFIFILIPTAINLHLRKVD